MGPRVTVSATDIQAFYDLAKGRLTLSADVDEVLGIYDIEFVRVLWFGALKFVIEGWILTPPSKPELTSTSSTNTQATKKQRIENHFQVPLERVVVADRDHPDGVVVDVHVIGGHFPAPPKVPEGETVGEAPTKIEDFTPEEDKKISVFYGGTFTVKQSAEVPQFGSVEIATDDQYLRLERSGIANGQIFWTFKAVSVGQTQADVVVAGGIAKYVIRIPYDIHIIPIGPGPVIHGGIHKLSIQADDKTAVSGDGDIGVPSLVKRITSGVDKVVKRYPDAKLFSVDASTVKPKGVPVPDYLFDILLQFRSEEGHVIIRTKGLWLWGEPEIIPGAGPFGPGDITWPGKFDVYEATDLLRKEHHPENFSHIKIYQNLKPDPHFLGLYYIFTLATAAGPKDVWITPIQS